MWEVAGTRTAFREGDSRFFLPPFGHADVSHGESRTGGDAAVSADALQLLSPPGGRRVEPTLKPAQCDAALKTSSERRHLLATGRWSS